MAKTSGRESITSLNIRVGNPPKQLASCRICNCPLGPSEQAVTLVVRCARCGVKYHEPCFWRGLPLSEWVEYIQRAMENDANEEDEGDDQDEDSFEIICAVCHEKEGA